MSVSLEVAPVQDRTAKLRTYAALLIAALRPGSQGVIEYFPKEDNNTERVREALTRGGLTRLLGVQTTYVPVLNRACNYIVFEARVLQRAGVGRLPSQIVMSDIGVPTEVPVELKGDPVLVRRWREHLPARAFDITCAEQLTRQPGLGRYAALGRPAVEPAQTTDLLAAAVEQQDELLVTAPAE